MSHFKKHIFYFLLLGLLSSCHVVRFFIYNFADKNDYKKFPNTMFKLTSESFIFFESELNCFNKPQNLTINDKEVSFEEYLKKNKTLGF